MRKRADLKYSKESSDRNLMFRGEYAPLDKVDRLTEYGENVNDRVRWTVLLNNCIGVADVGRFRPILKAVNQR